MSYQKVYEALNGGLKKKASSEQLVKLANLIGMRKKAEGTFTKHSADSNGSLYHALPTEVEKIIRQRADVEPQGWTAPGNIWNQYASQVNLPRIDSPKGQTLAPKQKYLQESLRVRNILNPYEQDTQFYKNFNTGYDELHNMKLRDVGHFSGTIREPWQWQHYRKHSQTFDEDGRKPVWRSFEDITRKRMEDSKDPIQELKDRMSPQDWEKAKRDPMYLIDLFSNNKRKPSYSQQLAGNMPS